MEEMVWALLFGPYWADGQVLLDMAAQGYGIIISVLGILRPRGLRVIHTGFLSW